MRMTYVVSDVFAKDCVRKAPLLKGEKGTRKSERQSMSFAKLQKTTLTDRLNEFANNARDEAKTLEPGPERQALLERARKAEAASELEAWANSPGLQGPK